MKQKLIFGQKAIGAALVVVAGATVISSAIAFTSFASSSAATLAIVGEAANSSQDMRTLQIVQRLTGDEREAVLAQYGFQSLAELNQKLEKRRITFQQQRENVVRAQSASQSSLIFFVAALIALSFLSARAATLLFKNANTRRAVPT
ncbi:hypothetical protein ASG35_12125 [Burkholderia sp. Leaf177]|uniref:hypothetical protein n=1 Tax=Burkholderia sp. Leaf177 TaxID=1736287 RepID=UPI0006FAD7F1|nr:hypothetical protein [Burkholderia sp. Leaf177]KQR77017.1 hypothetical protein ASG35_12125 [Burkholderia sp. Leaf177]